MKVLVSERPVPASTSTLVWWGRNASGGLVPRGAHLIRNTAADEAGTQSHALASEQPPEEWTGATCRQYDRKASHVPHDARSYARRQQQRSSFARNNVSADADSLMLRAAGQRVATAETCQYTGDPSCVGIIALRAITAIRMSIAGRMWRSSWWTRS